MQIHKESFLVAYMRYQRLLFYLQKVYLTSNKKEWLYSFCLCSTRYVFDRVRSVLFRKKGRTYNMAIFYIIFGFIVLLIFNVMTTAFCIKMELSKQKQKRMDRVTNMTLVAMLVCSYLRVLNVAV